LSAGEPHDLVAVVLDTAAGRVLTRVDPARYDVRTTADGTVELRASGSLGDDLGWDAGAVGTLLEGAPPTIDASVPPLTGWQVASLRPLELALVADGWVLDVRAARRGLTDDDPRRPGLDRAAGQAAVLRALAADVPTGDGPTWSQFVSTADAGLIGAPAAGLDVPPASHDGTPLGAQLAQRDQLLAVVGERREGFLPADEAPGQRTGPRVFAGLTVAAALVLTGCGSDPEAGDRRCVDGDGTVVGDDLCDDDSSRGGGGGFFFLYGGSTYVRDGKSYVRGGSTTAPKGGMGGRSGSGGG